MSRPRLASAAIWSLLLLLALSILHTQTFAQERGRAGRRRTPPARSQMAAPSDANVTLRSYVAARRVLDAAVEAYGGLEALRAVENFRVRFEGSSVQRNQSAVPSPPYDRTPLSGFVIVDQKRNRLAQEIASSFPGGFDSRSRFLVVGTEGVRLNMLERRAFPALNLTPAVIRIRQRWLPHNLLLNALDRASRLRSLGRDLYEGRPHDIITYANEDGLQLTLYLDEQTHMLSKFETLGTDAFSGDAVSETIFPAQRALGRLKVPTRRLLKVAGELTEEINYTEVAVNQTYGEETFKLPEGFTVMPPTPPAPPKLEKLADDAYVFSGMSGYNVMFVAFKDYVLVLEAPSGDAASREVIAKIRETVPDKPIRYVAVTHHHDDHAGGVRTYMAEGVTLVTTPGNRQHFERMAESRFTIDPDTLARKPRAPIIETIQNGRRTFTDGTHTVELYDIGAGPHTREMVVAYLPKERILFQGDLLNRPTEGYARAGNATTAHFAGWLQKSGLNVEKIVGVHGPAASMADLRRAVELMQAKTP